MPVFRRGLVFLEETMKLISILFAFAGLAGCDFKAGGSVDPEIDCTGSCEDDQSSCYDECDQTCIEDDDEEACVSDCDQVCDDDYDSCTVSCD